VHDEHDVVGAGDVGRPVRRAVVHDDHLDVVADRLGRERVEASSERP
jgi:hypothetical protein